MSRILIVHPAEERASRRVAEHLAARFAAAGHHVTVEDVARLGPALAHDQLDAVVFGGEVRNGRHAETLREVAADHHALLSSVPSAFFSLSDAAALGDGGESSRRLARRFIRHTGWAPDHVARFARAPDQTDWGLVDAFGDRLLDQVQKGTAVARPGRRALTLTALVTGAAATFAYYHRHVRPRLHDWGATEEEKQTRYPGDDCVSEVRDRATYAITIAAPRTDVWPFLAQMGTGRAGWYSYDLLDNAGTPSSEDVLPEHQQLHVGDLLPVDKAGRKGFPVLRLEPERHLVLGHPTDRDRHRPLAVPATGDSLVWSFHLEPRDHHHATRLIVRTAGSRSAHPWADALLAPLTETFVLLMQRRQLLGIKRRAERLYRSHLRQHADETGANLTPAGV